MYAFGAPGTSAGEAHGAADTDPLSLRRLSAVIWGPNEDTRLLLRGLLKLCHCPSVEEIADPTALDTLPTLTGPTVLVIDIEGRGAEWEGELRSALTAHPELRAIVLLPREGGPDPTGPRAIGACEVLRRPFTVPDFARAVNAAADAPPPKVIPRVP